MAFKVHTEHPSHFVASGRGGDFKIAKKGLSPARCAEFQAMCKGGVAEPQKLADGGEVKPETGAAEKAAAPAPRYRVTHEDDREFHVDDGSGKPFRVAKRGLSPKLHEKIRGFATGGDVKMAGGGAVPLDSIDELTSTAIDPAQVEALADASGASAPVMVETPEWLRPGPSPDAGPEALQAYDNAQLRQMAGTTQDAEMRDAIANEAQRRLGVNATAEEKQAAAHSVETALPPARMGDLHAAPAEVALDARPASGTGAPLHGGLPSEADMLGAGAGGPAFDLSPPPAIASGGASPAQRQLADARAQFAQGVNDQAALAQEKAQAEADAAAKAEEAVRVAHDARAAALQKNQEDVARLQDAIEKQQIDPNRFWASKSTGQRVSAAIGLILSGMGSGLAHQPNLAMQVIDNAIARDVDAQKAELGKKENLLSRRMQEGNSLREAELLTSRDLLAATAATAKAKMSLGYVSRDAKAFAAQQLGQMDMKLAALNDEIATHASQRALNGWQLAKERALWPYQMAGTQAELAQRAISLDWMRKMMQGGGAPGTGTPPGYLPSRAPPPLGSDPSNPMKFLVEAQKDAAERTLTGPGGKPFLALDKTVADKVRPQILAAQNVKRTVDELQALRDNFSGIPGTQAARQFHKLRASLPEMWAMANGLTQPSEVSNKNLEEVMPSSFDAFVRGRTQFQPILKLLHDRTRGLYEMAGLAPSALPIYQRPVQ